ncbi:MAG: hypothetical protein ACRDXD_12075 [Acidimicrobiia bacterium]
MRLLSAVGIVATCLLLITPAWAEDGILEERLAQAAEAEYSAEQLVVCWTPVGEVAGVYGVQQGGGMLLLSHGGSEAMLAGTEVINRVPGEGWRRVELRVPSMPALSARYRVEVGRTETYLGRPVQPVEVWEEDLLRVRFVFDAQTSVPLVTTVFAGDGSPFRMSSFTRFSTRGPKLVLPAGGPKRSVESAQPASLPKEAAGYELTDAYQGPHDGVHAYYTDGLFSFSVFEISGLVDPGSLPDTTELAVTGRTYRMRVMPSELWVLWSGEGHSYLLVGDLPPDHLEAVLGELPAPRSDGLLSRLRRAVFGG